MNKNILMKDRLIEKWEVILHQLNIDGLEMLDELFSKIADAERYIEQDEEKLQKLRALEEKDRKEEIEREVYAILSEHERRKVKEICLYKRNRTMYILGHQHDCAYIGTEGPAFDMFEEMREACKYSSPYELAMCAFSLGVIWGKRIDRKRRRGKAL